LFSVLAKIKLTVDPKHHRFHRDLDFDTLLLRGVRGLVWFDFEVKSHSNRKINKYVVWFG